MVIKLIISLDTIQLCKNNMLSIDRTLQATEMGIKSLLVLSWLYSLNLP